MQKKSVFGILIVSLLLISIFASISVASAQAGGATGGNVDRAASAAGNSFSIIPVWLSNNALFQGWKNGDTSVTEEYIKILVLLLLIILIYSAFAYADFPHNVFTRVLLSVVVGFLATLGISSTELLTALRSYTALGLTLLIFFPVLILSFFTYVAAETAKPFGIFAQKIMWIIYSVYLFFTSLALLLLKWDASRGTLSGTGWVVGIYKFFFGTDYAKLPDTVSSTVLIVLFVVSIAVFVVFVLSSKPVTAWMAHEAREADMMSQKDKLKRSQALRDAEADATRKGGKE